MALKVKALKNVGVTTTNNPDIMIRQNTDNEIINKLNERNVVSIKYSEWKSKVEHRGKIYNACKFKLLKSQKQTLLKCLHRIWFCFVGTLIELSANMNR